MRRRRPIITATVLVFTVVVLAIAMNNARADCVDGVRNVTPAELDFAQRARAALVAGLPEAVRPIERRSPNRPDPGGSVNMSPCRGTPVGAFSPSASDGFLFQFTREEATARSDQRQQLRRQIEDIERLPPDKEAQRKDIEAQMRAAYAAAPTRSRKDPPFTPEQQAQVDRAQAEGRALEQAMRRIASLTAQNISVRIEGPAGPARDALAGLVDRAYLQALLGKPLPTVDASRARIAAVIAQAAGAPALAIAASMPTAASAAPAVAASPATAAAPIVPPAAAPAAAASAAPAAASTATPPATTAAARSPSASPCPPPARSAQNSTDAARSGGQAGAAVGSEVGGAVLGGGWGRSVGSAVGGALGALGGAAKKQEPPADCPR